jgi:phage terminase large subunit
MTAPAQPAQSIELTYKPRGAARVVFAARDPEVVLSGPAGTGKSRAALEKVHLALLKHPGARGLMLRKTRRSLTESGMVTYSQKVLHPLDGVPWRAGDQQYQYPNGSILAVAGLDKASKVMSSEWDMIYVQEATELAEPEWEALTTRLRNGRMPYQQLLADCNPDAPTHWLRQRMDIGKTRELPSVHEDNPVLFDDNGVPTLEGVRYLATLDALSGVRYSRLRLGLWVSAEGMVYQDAWERKRNLVDRADITGRTHNPLYGDGNLPREWPRYMSVDFGYTNPFVCQWWALDPDGRLYLYRELYRSKWLVEDCARAILHYAKWNVTGGRLQPNANNADPLPRAIFCDHDAEGRATLERHLGWYTTPAEKAISDGIQAVAARMKPAGDGKPRLYVLQGSLVERDPVLADAKLPCGTTEEIESYVWDTRGGRARGEEPLDKDNHGMDAMRYMCATLDRRPTQTSQTTFKVF